MTVGASVDSPPLGAGRLPSADTLWLAMLDAIAGRAAHELKGMLNGVSVNLEVVRSRSTKPDAPASAVAKFAAAAADQLEGVIAMSEGLLALARGSRDAVDVGRTARWVGNLLVPAARADGHELTLDGPFDEVGPSVADGSAVRLAIGAAMLDAVAATRAVCRAVPDSREPSLRFEAEGARAFAIAEATLAVIQAAGIRILAEPSAISIMFPR